MKKMFSCSSNQVSVECWNKHDQKLLDAVEKGDVGKVSVLMSKKTAKPTKPNAIGQSAFHLAASKGLTECLTVLLNHGAEVNDRNDDGSTALHLATIACQPQCVKVLLQHGANEDCVDGENRTPLHWAALSGCASSVLLLCDQEAFLDVMDNNGQTPLMMAAQGNQAAICSQLLQRGAKADLVDTDGKTALILACERGNMEAAELLLQNGANVALEDRAGRGALHYATQGKNRTLRRLVHNALRKRKRREQGLDLSSEAGSQAPSESGKEMDRSILDLPLEGRGPNDEEDVDQETEEDPELKEWTSRYREEKMKVIQLELQLAQKTRECDSLLEGCKAMKERVWDQVQEISQILPEGEDQSQDWKELSRRYSRDATEEDYYLNLLAEQIQELKRRKKRMEAEKEEKEKEKEEKEHPQKSHPKEVETTVAPQKEGRVQWPGEEEEEERRCHQMEVKRLQAEMAAAYEEKASALKRVQEMEGHMENMRAVIRVYEAKKKHQSGTLKETEARLTELEGENQQLRGMLAKRMDGGSEAGLAKVSRFLTEMEEAYSEIQKENRAMKAAKEALKREAEDAVGSRLLFQTVPSEVVKKSMFAWKRIVAGLEDALAKMEQTNAALLEKVRPLREAILTPQSGVGVMVNGNGCHAEESGASRDEAKPLMRNLKTPNEMEIVGSGKSQLHDGSVGQVKLRSKPEVTENKARPCRKSSDLEKEVWDLKENNGSLVKELAQLSKEREKLQAELRRLCGPKERPPQPEVMGSLVEELKKAVDSLSQQLSAEKEESRKLRLKLESQTKEMAVVRDSFLEKMAKEATALVRSDTLDSCILKELHWKLDNVVKKQNEALQLVSEIEEENHTLETDRKIHAGHNGHLSPPVEKALPDVSSEALDAIRDNRKVHREMDEMEKVLQGFKEVLEAIETSLGKENKEVAKLKALVGQLKAKMSDLRREEEEALRKHEKVRGMLCARAQALGIELASLREKYEGLRGESVRRKEDLVSERQKNQDLLAEVVEREEEVEELRGKSQMMETVMEKMDRKVEELSKACQDRDGKIRKLLKETEKLSSEILNLRSERARLRLQNEVVQKNHQEIVAIYRTHLLNAAQGFMDKEVHEMLLRILRTNDG